MEETLVQVARPGIGWLSHVLVSDGEAAVFDPSYHVDEYESVLVEHDADLIGVFDIHAHADHVSDGRRLSDRHGGPSHLHPADAIASDASPAEDGLEIVIGDIRLEGIHSPGHSLGVSRSMSGARRC